MERRGGSDWEIKDDGSDAMASTDDELKKGSPLEVNRIKFNFN